MANFESNIKYTLNVGNYQKNYYEDLEFELYQLDFTSCLKNLSATNINSLKRLKVVNCFWMETLCNLWNLCSFMNKIINAETSA